MKISFRSTLQFLQNKLLSYIKQHKIRSLLLASALLYYIFCLPKNLFEENYATIVESREGKLLGGKIAPDGQ